jgi:hypothetical protein
VHHVMMHMVDHVMMHHVMAATLGFHGDCFSAIGGSLCISRGLLGARRGSLRRGSRLLRRVGGSFSALRGRCRLSGCGLRLLRGVLSGASSKQRESQRRPGKRD